MSQVTYHYNGSCTLNDNKPVVSFPPAQPAYHWFERTSTFICLHTFPLNGVVNF